MKHFPYLRFEFGPLKIPYGVVPSGLGFLLGFAQANDLQLDSLTEILSISAPSIIGAARGAIGSKKNLLEKLSNYIDAKDQTPIQSPLTRGVVIGARYQLEALLGYTVGYLYGKISP